MGRISLSRQIADQLRREIHAGSFASTGRLPSELVLGRDFRVSRATVREALRALEQEGLVVRRHGVGSFVSRRVTAGLERLESFTETIRRAGGQASDQVLDIRPVALDAEAAAALHAAPGDRGILIRSLRFANGDPVLYCEDLLPARVVSSVEQVQQRRERESLLDFLRLDLGLDVREAVLALAAVSAPARVAAILRVRPRAPLLRLTGTVYDATDRPVYSTTNHVRTDRYVFTVARR
ncbi:MAG: GntR family transcriptional regulator [Armatimonadota bacterium]|nr:GntR family transcriptional regulator [Armatimonadota bacterium]MDR7496982.1 GntR family transcriptional regulator [Armatimonadota bacterium]MDR7510764.1 GntR family transcriptional regulator [Armatimonadota bacterium]